jgi:hypothetical protein
LKGRVLLASLPEGGEEERMRVALPLRWVFALLACPVAAAAADLPATLTLLEGPVGLVRGVTRYALAEGVRMQAGDIIEVGDKGLAEFEFPDGAAIAMGPGTRMLAISMPRGKSAAGDFHVMAGVLKVSGVSKDARLRISTPAFTLWPVEGASVMVVRGGEGSVFVEGGAARLAAPPATHSLKSGEFFSRKDGQKGAVSQRPSKPFMDAMPKAFFDPLPSRMARYQDREGQPRRIEEVSYADVEVWLKAPPGIRRPLVGRFESRAGDPKFRAALEANLRFHPEWDPILYPEKYLPPETAADKAEATPAAKK